MLQPIQTTASDMGQLIPIYEFVQQIYVSCLRSLYARQINLNFHEI